MDTTLHTGLLMTDGVDRAYPDVVSRFRRIAASHVASPALRAGAEAVTYGELDRLSDALAATLLARGVAPGHCVGVSGSYGLHTAVVLLGILKAGAFYVYLDAALPARRLGLMADTLAVRLVVAPANAHEMFAALGMACIATGDAMAAAGAVHASTPVPSLERTASALAYVNYSSGSTGQPKAIACRDGGITRLCVDQPVLGLGASTAMLVNAPLSFDASTLEIWGPLLNGGTCVFHTERLLSPAGLRVLVEQQGVNTLWLTSALFNAIVDLDATCLNGLRCVMVGGEALSVAHVRRAMQANRGVRFINGYGPTENTTFTACHRVTEADLLQPALPIGTPINGTGVVICDAQLAPLPPGQIGELVTFGAGLAHGYLGNPELNARKFPTLTLDGVARRVYRSGDRVRLNADGLLEYHGRMDKEVKINGFRIDLAELENFLRTCPGVRDCVLVDVERHGGKLLLAAIVPVDDRDGDGTLAALESGWLNQLPPHERPHALFVIDALPLTANGKLDRAALIERWRGSDELSLAGLTAAERGCAALWRRHVGHLPSSRRSDFFAAGGNSLLALRLLAEAARHLRVSLPIDEFYAASRFEDFCRWLDSRGAGRMLPGEVDSGLVRIAPCDNAAADPGGEIAAEADLAAALAQRFPDPAHLHLFAHRGELFVAGETAELDEAARAWLAARQRAIVGQLSGRALECELNPCQRSMVLDELFNGNLDGNSMFHQLHPARPWTVTQLQRASDRLHRRHPLLSARVGLEGERFVFVLEPDTPPPAVHDDPHVYADEDAFRQRYLHHPHSVLEPGYLRLVRAHVAGHPVFGAWLHHIAADGPFVSRLLCELRAVLEDDAEAQTDAAPADFSFVQQNWRIARRLEREAEPARRYWRAQRTRIAALGTDAPPGLRSATALAERDCSATRTAALLQLAISRKQGLLPMFAVLLQQTCATVLDWRPHLFATTCSLREGGISQDGAGCYINLLPLPLESRVGDTEAAIATAGYEALQAMASACLPYEDLAEACGGLAGRESVLINVVEERADHPHDWAQSCNALKVRRPLTLTAFLRAGRLMRLTLAGRLAQPVLVALLDGLVEACDRLLNEERAHVRDDLATA
ncbi:amino acid adenylation domain-containing protein [Burkholderia plantarii]|uniref:amino acid adenylation domain-containing protein n=1 Tax=Burkholderia plantarii TaxID=41899 RepID=UPI0009F219EC|nr:amino acid adenylation domain-containing protein [Burkholderia plantarii]